MGRIEEALERALQKRSAGTDLPEELQPESSASLAAPEDPAPLFGANPRLVTLSSPHSVIAEEFRKLKSKVVGMTKQAGFRNAIMVTSALGGEGKSFTSMNLAASIAQEYDHTVLLVDADLRRPSLTEYLGLPPSAGITDCLAGDADLGSVIIKTGLGGLSLLPAGKASRNPVELLSSQKMRELFMEIKNRYPDRYLVIDTPPLLPFAETQAFCAMVDSIILVVRQEMTPIQSIRDSLDLLEADKVLGIVYNGVSSDILDSRYNYYYYSRYRGHTS